MFHLNFTPSDPSGGFHDRRRARIRRRRWHQTLATVAAPNPGVPAWGDPTE